MQAWDVRSREVAFLLNPAFCSRIIYSVISTYQNDTKRSMPFPLVYIILPLILHEKTRKKIDSRTKFLNWIKRYPQLLIDFSARAKDLIQITQEAIELLLLTNKIIISSSGELEINNSNVGLSKTKFVDEEISECLVKSEHVARWFATTGKVETIYISLGVRP